MFQSDRWRVRGGLGRCPNPTGRSVSRRGSLVMSQFDQPKSSVSRLMSQSSRSVLLAVGVVVVVFVVFFVRFLDSVYL